MAFCLFLAVCGGELNMESGELLLKSPNYPEVYGHDMECTWVITVPKGQVVLNFQTKFEVI